MGILFTSCAIILHNFLEINNDIWDVDEENNMNNENNNFISDYTRENDDMLKRAGQAKRDWIFCQHF